MPESILIEAPSAPLALSLIERLDGFHAELVPLGGERFHVRVELDGLDGRNRGPMKPLLDSLDRIESWLEVSGLDVAEIHLHDRSYELERRDGSKPLPSVQSELRGVLCQVRTIPPGAGVQVVSVEGELDLHTCPQLVEALKSTDSAQVVLDLTDAPFIDSTTLGLIIDTSKRMRGQDRKLLVVAGNPTVARVLQLTGLDRALAVRPALAETLEAALDGHAARGPE
jgi:anti-sigma B factor antagonist